MKTLVVLAAVLLAGCGKFNDMVHTAAEGYTIRCITGTSYVLLTSDRGLAISPLLNTEGKPKGCEK